MILKLHDLCPIYWRSVPLTLLNEPWLTGIPCLVGAKHVDRPVELGTGEVKFESR